MNVVAILLGLVVVGGAIALWVRGNPENPLVSKLRRWWGGISQM